LSVFSAIAITLAMRSCGIPVASPASNCCCLQIADIETERNAAIKPDAEGRPSPITLLTRLKAIGPQIGAVLYHEGLYRNFTNRRNVAAYAGLVPTPWRSGSIDREQGISKAGNPRLLRLD
jgi:transposase